jgi:hypothetical protein
MEDKKMEIQRMTEQEMDMYMYDGGIANVGASDWNSEASAYGVAGNATEARVLQDQHEKFKDTIRM